MRTKQRNFAIAIVGFIMAIAMVLGFTSINAKSVYASSGDAPQLTMVAGAQARYNAENPGIKFTAEIKNYNTNYTYGMLILPEKAFTNLTVSEKSGIPFKGNYHAYFADEGIDNYVDVACGVYNQKAEDGSNPRISLALTHIKDYNMGFVGVAYAKSKDGSYIYADVDMAANARSISLVAQIALKNEPNLDATKKDILGTFAAGDYIFETKDQLNNGNLTEKGEETMGDYAMKYIFNASGETVSQITKKAYPGGSTVSFKYKIPEGTVVTAGTDKYGNPITTWWGIAWHTDPNMANIYHAAGAENPIGHYKLSTATIGSWVDVSFTLPEGGNYYLYFGSEVGGAAGRWLLADGQNSYALIDDFKIGDVTESFGEFIENSIFEVKSDAGCTIHTIQAPEYSFGPSVEPEISAKIIVDKINSAEGTASFITKQKYSAGDKISFMYYVPSDVTSSWFAVCGVTDTTKTDIYNNWLWQGNLAKGSWQKMTVTLDKDCYVHFAGSVGDWGGKDNPKTEGYVLIDNFTVNGEVVEDFNDGVQKSIFNVNTASAIVDGEGYVDEFEASEYAMKYIPNAISGETPAMVTKEAYAGGSTVSFKYFVPKGTILSAGKDPNNNTINTWWGLAYSTSNSGLSIYDAANASKAKVIQASQTILGSWTDVSFTLPAGGPYYLYFGGEKSTERWLLADGTNSYILIDNLTIGGETEDFNNGLDASIFEVKDSSTVQLSDGFVEQPKETGEIAMKYIFNASGETVSQVTKEAYAGGSTVSFKYFIPAGTETQWWGLVWSTSNTGLNIYAAADASKAKKFEGSATVTGAWTNVEFTLPAGGPYYLYFGSEVGHWKINGENSYMLIDEFTVNGETESFNNGVEDSIFKVLVAGTVVDSEVGEGWTPSPLGAQLKIDKISSTATTPSFITAKAYTFTEATVVTFDFYMTGNTNNKWWSLCWTSNNTKASIYAHTGDQAAYGSGKTLPTTQNAWVTASVEIPAGTWYFYIGGAVNEWSGGSVIIDNFVAGNVVSEDFNSGLGIFLDNRESRYADAIELVAGREDFVEGENAVRFDFANSFNSDATTFITKKAYAGGSTVSFMYYIPEETTAGDWWSINWDTTNTSPNFWAVGNGMASPNGGINPNPSKVKGQWLECSFTLPEGGPYYLYFCGYQNWSGYVYVDNFTVNGEVETFNSLPDGWIFNINSAEVFIGEGVAIEIPETPEEPVNTDPNALENLIKNGTIVEFLENGGYSSIFNKNASAINPDGLPENALLMEGRFDYAITDEKEFAIYLGNSQFIVIDQDSIALYIDKTLIKSVALDDAENDVFLSITVGGKVVVGLDGNFVGLGILPEDVTTIKFVALGGNGKVSFTYFDIISYECVLANIPAYYSAEGIDFTAYAFDSNAMVSDKGFQYLAEAGFTKTLALLQGRVSHLDGMAGDENYTGNKDYAGDPDNIDEAEVIRLMEQVNKDAIAALDLAEKYGLKHYVFNEALYNLERHTNWYAWVEKIESLATYKTHSAFAGHFLADEPKHTRRVGYSKTELEEFVNAYGTYSQEFEGAPAYVNLLPISTTAENTYKEYVKYYVENIAVDKNGVKGTGYVSYDHYPLKSNSIDSRHLLNAEIVAELCRDYGLDFHAVIKASTSGDSARSLRATQSVNDLYMQIYSMLCYGAKEIVYYQYTDHTKADDTAGDAVMSGTSLEKGNVYNWAKQANNEVHAFDAAYMNFTWKSVSVYGKTSITSFNNLNSKADPYGYISKVDSSASVLVGNFDDADGSYTHGAKHAYMVMNYGNTKNASSTKTAISITFNGTPKRALVYQGGKPEVITLSSNVLTLNLMIGEGAFVIPLV